MLTVLTAGIIAALQHHAQMLRQVAGELRQKAEALVGDARRRGGTAGEMQIDFQGEVESLEGFAEQVEQDPKGAAQQMEQWANDLRQRLTEMQTQAFEAGGTAAEMRFEFDRELQQVDGVRQMLKEMEDTGSLDDEGNHGPTTIGTQPNPAAREERTVQVGSADATQPVKPSEDSTFKSADEPITDDIARTAAEQLQPQRTVQAGGGQG